MSNNFQNVELVEADPVATPNDPIITDTACYTNQQSCAGLAHWYNNDRNNATSFTVWWDNGSGGRTNFVLRPGESHSLHVRYNDTYSWAWGDQGVPDNNTRWYIWVA